MFHDVKRFVVRWFSPHMLQFLTKHTVGLHKASDLLCIHLNAVSVLFSIWMVSQASFILHIKIGIVEGYRGNAINDIYQISPLAKWELTTILYLCSLYRYLKQKSHMNILWGTKGTSTIILIDNIIL